MRFCACVENRVEVAHRRRLDGILVDQQRLNSMIIGRLSGLLIERQRRLDSMIINCQRRLNDEMLVHNLLSSHQGTVGRYHHCVHLNPVRLEHWVGRGRGRVMHVVVHLAARHHIRVSVSRGDLLVHVVTMCCGLFSVYVSMCCGHCWMCVSTCC